MSLEQKFSYGDIQKYKDIRYQSASRMQVLGRQEMVQCKCFFLVLSRQLPAQS